MLSQFNWDNVYDNVAPSAKVKVALYENQRDDDTSMQNPEPF
jgi:hypothetical protein